MAKIINDETKEELEVLDGEPIKKACMELGIPFACEDGICGTCMIEIVEGEDNLTDLTKNEEYLGRDKNHRLACQCKIKSGVVKIKY